MLDVVLVLQRRAAHTLAPATLLAERVDVDRLHVALVREHDDDFLVLDEVQVVELAGVERDLRTARLGELLAHLGELFLDDGSQLLVALQDRLELLDGRLELVVLVLQLLLLELGEPAQRHVQDVVRLDLRELERLRHETLAGRIGVLRAPDEGDDRVDGVERPDEPLDDVVALLGLAQPVLGAAGEHVDLVRDVAVQRVGEVQRARHAVHQRQHVHAEAGLHRRVLVEVVQRDERVGVLLQLDDELRVPLRRLVAQPAHPVELAVVHEVGDLALDAFHRRLVRDLGDDDAIAVLAFFDLGDGAHPDRAATGRVRVHRPRATEDQRPGREVGALHELHQVGRSRVGVIDEVHRRVDDLGQVVRRDVRGHTHGDPLAAVHQEVREARGKHDRFTGLAVVAVDELDGVLVDAGEHLHRDRRELALRVARPRRAGTRGPVSRTRRARPRAGGGG